MVVATRTDGARASTPAHPRSARATPARAVVAILPVAAVLLVATRYRESWYLSDEWRVLERTVGESPVRATFELYNGHLYSVPILLYRAQLASGLDGHAIVWIAFCLTLVACNVAVARLLWVAGVPAVAAVVAGVLITYFGPGAQLMTLEFQLGVVGAIALSMLAGVLVLTRTPSLRSGALVAGVLLVATTFDSGTASVGVVFVAVLLASRWRDRWALVALGPALAVGAVVLVAARTSPRLPGTFGTEVSFGFRLVLLAAGGLAGGGEIAGAIVLLAAAALLAPALATGRIGRDARECLVAGVVAAVAMTAVLAATRADIVKANINSYNRYIPMVAVFLLVALLPALLSVARDLARARADWVGPLAAVVLTVAFAVNLGPLLRYRGTVESWQRHTRVLIAESYEQLARGCAPHQPVAADVNPLGIAYGPGVTVTFLRELRIRGSLHPRTGVRVSAAVRDASCPR